MFSVVITAFQVETELRAAIESVTSQTFVDLELIAVNDGSPDRSGSVIDEYAALDPRVRPIHLGVNGGPSKARNIGVSAADGMYILFLDGDDVLLPGALAAIDARLATLDFPDILQFSVRHAHPCGINLVETFPDEIAYDQFLDVTDRPEILEELPGMAWNKAYSRRLIRRHGLHFPPGLYEDMPWALFTVLSAQRIGLSLRPCVEYRRCRVGSITTTPTADHLDLLAQCERIFEYLNHHEQRNHAAILAAVFRRIERFLYSVGYVKSQRLPRELLEDFHRESSILLHKYRPAGLTSGQVNQSKAACAFDASSSAALLQQSSESRGRL